MGVGRNGAERASKGRTGRVKSDGLRACAPRLASYRAIPEPHAPKMQLETHSDTASNNTILGVAYGAGSKRQSARAWARSPQLSCIPLSLPRAPSLSISLSLSRPLACSLAALRSAAAAATPHTQHPGATQPHGRGCRHQGAHVPPWPHTLLNSPPRSAMDHASPARHAVSSRGRHKVCLWTLKSNFIYRASLRASETLRFRRGRRAATMLPGQPARTHCMRPCSENALLLGRAWL